MIDGWIVFKPMLVFYMHGDLLKDLFVLLDMVDATVSNEQQLPMFRSGIKLCLTDVS